LLHLRAARLTLCGSWCFFEQPAAGITPAMFGAPVSEQEAEDLSKR
jgi:hypothetical protein